MKSERVTDRQYLRIMQGCILLAFVSAMIYDRGFHVIGLGLAVVAGVVSTVVWFQGGHR